MVNISGISNYDLFHPKKETEEGKSTKSVVQASLNKLFNIDTKNSAAGTQAKNNVQQLGASCPKGKPGCNGCGQCPADVEAAVKAAEKAISPDAQNFAAKMGK